MAGEFLATSPNNSSTLWGRISIVNEWKFLQIMQFRPLYSSIVKRKKNFPVKKIIMIPISFLGVRLQVVIWESVGKFSPQIWYIYIHLYGHSFAPIPHKYHHGVLNWTVQLNDIIPTWTVPSSWFSPHFIPEGPLRCNREQYLCGWGWESIWNHPIWGSPKTNICTRMELRRNATHNPTQLSTHHSFTIWFVQIKPF